MWILRLNDMRSPKIEMLTTVCRSDSFEALADLLVREKVEHYMDDRWGKVFRRGGPLEWFNEPFENPFFQMKTEEQMVEELRARYRADISDLPDVSMLR